MDRVTQITAINNLVIGAASIGLFFLIGITVILAGLLYHKGSKSCTNSMQGTYSSVIICIICIKSKDKRA